MVKYFTALVFITCGAAVSVATHDRVEAAHDPFDRYRIGRLESLGGTNNRANSINDWGLLAGFSDLPGGQARRASLWLLGHRHTIGTFGGTNSSVGWPVKNNIGLVVGIAQTDVVQPRGAQWSCRIFFPGPDNTKYTCLGFAWQWGHLTRLPTLGGDNGFATGANNLRQVVGWAENTVEDDTCLRPIQVLQFRAVQWDLNRSRMTELLPVGDDSSSAATAINDRGQVVGISGTCDQAVGRFSARHAVIWENGVARPLDDLGAGAWNTPTAINQRGDVIAGFALPEGGDPFSPNLRAVAWTTRTDVCIPRPGTNICDLGKLKDHVSSQANGVNDRGQIVGTSCPATGFCRGFVFEHGVMKDMNDLTAGRFDEQIENAQDINEHGQIAGRSIRLDTQARTAIVANPVALRGSR